MTTTRFRFRDDRGMRLSITRRQRDAMTDTTTTSAPNIEERVRKIIVQMLDVDPDRVTLEADFIDKLGADSLDFVELTMSFEEEFDIEIPDDKAAEIKTVGDAVRYLTEATTAAA